MNSSNESSDFMVQSQSVLDHSSKLLDTSSESKNSAKANGSTAHVSETEESEEDSDDCIIPATQVLAPSHGYSREKATPELTKIDSSDIVEETDDSDEDIIDGSQLDVAASKYSSRLFKQKVSSNITSSAGSSGSDVINSSRPLNTDGRKTVGKSSNMSKVQGFSALSRVSGINTNFAMRPMIDSPITVGNAGVPLASTPTLDPSTPSGRWRNQTETLLSDDEEDEVSSPVSLPIRRKNIFDSAFDSPDISNVEKEAEDLPHVEQSSSPSLSKGNAKCVASCESLTVDISVKSKQNTTANEQSVQDCFDDSIVVTTVRKQKKTPFIIESDESQSMSHLDSTINCSSEASVDESRSNSSNYNPSSANDDTLDSIASSPVDKYGGKYKIKKKSSPVVTPVKFLSKSSSNHHYASADISNNMSPRNESSNSSLNISNLSANEVKYQLKQKKTILRTVDLSALPDKGEKLLRQVDDLEKTMKDLSMNASIEDSDASHPNDNSISVLDVSSSSSNTSEASVSNARTHKRGNLQPIPTQLQPIGEYAFRYQPPSPVKEEVFRAEKLSDDNEKIARLENLVKIKRAIYQSSNLRAMPDGGAEMQREIACLERELMMIQLRAGPTEVQKEPSTVYKQTPLGNLDKVNMNSASTTAKGGASGATGYTQPNLPQHVIDALYAADNKYGNRDYGGKLSHNREREMIRVTSDTVEQFQAVLKSMPDTEGLDPDSVVEPKGLNVDLMPHQKRALTWMLWREAQDPPGGILADDMGLGKTLTMLSLILRHQELLKDGSIEDFAMKNLRDEDSDEEDEQKAHGWLSRNRMKKLRKTQGTLVVCPASLIGQWETEAKKRISSRKMSVLVYHGSNRDTNVGRLCQHDLVVTTYQLAMKEAFGKGGCKTKVKNSDGIPTVFRSDQGSLYQIGWARIILDEAHVIRNHKSQTAQAMCMLKGGRRWIVTGTPVQNKEMDLFSLIRFLRISPFDDYTCWKHQITNGSAQGMRRLELLVKTIMMRRTKNQVDKATGKQLVELPEKKVIEHTLSLSQEERQIYDRVFTFSRSSLINYMKTHEQKELEKEAKTSLKPVVQPVVDENVFTPTLNMGTMLDTGVKTHHLLVLLLRLRQVCCHPSLIKAILDEEEDSVDPIEGVSKAERSQLEVDLLAQLQDMTLQETDDLRQEAGEKIEQNFFTLSNPVFDPLTVSSKIERVIMELVAIKEKGRTNSRGEPDRENGHREKAVIVSQWTSMLTIVRRHLEESGMKTLIIDGQVAVKEREPIVNDFNNNPKGPKVLLLSLGAGGVGLNLIGGNHLFLLDMHWNPQLEAQACDRIYRVGQKRPVNVHRFVVENTVEVKILELQKKKLQLAEDVLSGAKKRPGENKLTLNELKTIFNVA